MTPSPFSPNVVAFLRAAAKRVGTRPALVLEDEWSRREVLTFESLWDRVARFSAGLSRAGLAPGGRAILMIPMSTDLYVALLAVLKLGAVGVFVDPWIGRRQIAAFSAFAEPAAYIGVFKSHLLRWMDRRLRAIPLAVTTGRRLGRWPARHSLAELSSGDPIDDVYGATPTDPALITFTSGSSGVPKGANRTHGFLAAQHAALKAEFPYHDDDVDMTMFPVFALNNIALGITTIVPRMDFRRVDEVEPAVILDQMSAHRVTTCTASPPFFDRLAAHVGAAPGSDPQLRRILTGGAPVRDEQLRTWRRAFPKTEILVVYGSTEAEPVAHIEAGERLDLSERLAANSGERPSGAGFCVGKPTERLRTRVIRVQRGPISLEEAARAGDLGPGQVGELVVAGDHVCKDYYRNPTAVADNKVTEADGTIWHRMGDTGYFDEAGRFWLVGRVHSTIMRAGEFVHPQLVEEAARNLDERIRRVAAVGVRDPDLGERVVVVIETSVPEVATRVKNALRKRDLPIDDVVARKDPLPLDPRHNSKIDYEKLRMEVHAT